MRKYILFFAHRFRRATCKPMSNVCISYSAIIACFFFCAGDSTASPPADNKSTEPLIYTDKERGERKRLIVNSVIPIGVTHRYIKNALYSQGEIHWDERVFANIDDSVELSSKLDFRHIEYSIEEYRGDGCSVTFSRRLVTRDGSVSSEGVSVEVGDTNSSSRTVRFDAAEVKRIRFRSRTGAIRKVHPEMNQQKSDDRTSVRAFVVAGDIDIDGKSAEEIAVYVSLSELADGVSFADEFEAWLFHLVRMCRYADENEVV